jgi:hypothetical protein
MEKVPLKDILGAIDLNARSIWKELTESQKKSITQSFFVLNRYASCVQGNRQEQENAILKTNEFFNKHYMAWKNDPEFQCQLLCLCGNTGKIFFHKFIYLKTIVSKNVEMLSKLYPNRKLDELELLEKINTEEDLLDLFEDHGLDVRK